MKDKKIKELTDKFSKIKSVTKYVTTTKFDTIKLTYKDSIPCNFERIGSDLKNGIILLISQIKKELRLQS